MSFGKNVTGFNLVHFFSRSFDKILIGSLYGAHWLGFYTNTYRLLAMPVNHIQYPVNTVAFPGLSALQTEPVKFREYYEEMLRLLTFFSLPIVVFAALFADVIVGLLLGTQWMEAVPIFRVLAVGAFVEPVVHSVGPAMVAAGQTKEYFRLGTVNAAVLLGCLTVGSFWEPVGVAIGYSAAMYLALGVCIVYGLRKTCIDILAVLRQLAASTFCSLSTALVLLGARYAVGWSFPPRWFPLFAIGGAFTYLVAWLLLPEGKGMLLDYGNYTRHAISDAISGMKRRMLLLVDLS
jgi:PST family polysaccharide transporter